ncbi:MAG: addiction module protein [Alphaproteobacteria bacterium]|nr:addiction module protein [Alphaproteobacteria bacterium]
MMSTPFHELSTAEKILHVQDLWDQIAAEVADQPLSEAMKAELDRRLEAYRADPSGGIPWEQVKAEMRRRH